MRRIILYHLAVAFSIYIMGQKYSAYYYQRISFFETLQGSMDDIIFIGKIINAVRIQSPRTHLYVQSTLPVNDYYSLFEGHMDKGTCVND